MKRLGKSNDYIPRIEKAWAALVAAYANVNATMHVGDYVGPSTEADPELTEDADFTVRKSWRGLVGR